MNMLNKATEIWFQVFSATPIDTTSTPHGWDAGRPLAVYWSREKLGLGNVQLLSCNFKTTVLYLNMATIIAVCLYANLRNFNERFVYTTPESHYTRSAAPVIQPPRSLCPH